MNNLSTLYRLSIYLFLFSLPLLINAQKKTSTSTITLNEVILKSIKTDKPKKIVPLSLSYVNLNNQQKFFQKLSLQEYLISVPGLFTQNANNYEQDSLQIIKNVYDLTDFDNAYVSGAPSLYDRMFI